MKGEFLLGSNEAFIEGNIYAERSSLVLDWLLRVGVIKEDFSLREVAKDRGVSVGLVQKVFGTLVVHGLLQVEGLRTAKRFSIKNPEALLKSWTEHYSVVKKCKMWAYRSSFQNKEEILEALHESDLKSRTALALHSAAAAYGYKNTNLETLELYLLDPSIKKELEQTLELEPQERGYEVLLIKPHYKSLLKLDSPLLTFLDLYHFPLRGQEQAEFMAERLPELKRIYKRE